MSRGALSAVLRSSPCFLIQIFYGDQKGKPRGKLSAANEGLSHDVRKWLGHIHSEGESCRSGQLRLPFARSDIYRSSPSDSNRRSLSCQAKPDRGRSVVTLTCAHSDEE